MKGKQRGDGRMKDIRRAAAVCLTMTLAVSTLFGNTAWADMPQKTERKKCVHVHTEECYGEPDEEATSSQIGEEPTECTHVCTVESGCIRNTASSSGTGADDSETGRMMKKPSIRKILLTKQRMTRNRKVLLPSVHHRIWKIRQFQAEQ